jgi:hypothetical protein
LPRAKRGAQIFRNNSSDRRRFDPETHRILGLAFELTIALEIGKSGDEVKQAIAEKIIELVKTGERNPPMSCANRRSRISAGRKSEGLRG